MKKKVLLVGLIFILTVFLTSCNKVPAGEEPMETSAVLKQVQTGTEGVRLNLMPNQPPNQIYDQNELISLVEIQNKGNHDLTAQDCFVQVTGFDPNIIKGGFDISRSCAENVGMIEGKNVYNVKGDYNTLEFRSPNIGLPLGVFEYNPNLKFSVCYNYHTVANPSVCVDPKFYQVSSEQKSCTPQNVALGGGQGAPVGVTYVGVDMIGSKAVFEINVKNLGGGRVLSPYTDLRSCGSTAFTYQDFDKVAYNVKLSGGSLVNCKPADGFVRLNNGNGKVVCSFSAQGTAAYESILTVELVYNYLDSISKQIKIIKTPQ